MISSIFYILIALLITYAVFYYGSGLYFHIAKCLRIRKDISYFEKETMKMENILNNETAFQKLDSRQKKDLRDKIARYRETLSDIRQNKAG